MFKVRAGMADIEKLRRFRRAGNQGKRSIPEDNPICKLPVRLLIYNDIVAVSKFRIALRSALPQRSQYDLNLLNNS